MGLWWWSVSSYDETPSAPQHDSPFTCSCALSPFTGILWGGRGFPMWSRLCLWPTSNYPSQPQFPQLWHESIVLAGLYFPLASSSPELDYQLFTDKYGCTYSMKLGNFNERTSSFLLKISISVSTLLLPSVCPSSRHLPDHPPTPSQVMLC